MNSLDKSDIFLSVIDLNKGILYKVANSYCKNPEDRADLVQEMIMQLWKSFDKYSDEYKYSTWIYRIALNVAISFYRKETNRKQVSNRLPDGIFYFADHHDRADIEENMGFLQQFISELNDFDKALVLLYLDEKNHKEIAEIMGISETNVATKIGRIKNILKQKFSSIKT